MIPISQEIHHVIRTMNSPFTSSALDVGRIFVNFLIIWILNVNRKFEVGGGKDQIPGDVEGAGHIVFDTKLIICRVI